MHCLGRSVDITNHILLFIKQLTADAAVMFSLSVMVSPGVEPLWLTKAASGGVLLLFSPGGPSALICIIISSPHQTCAQTIGKIKKYHRALKRNTQT